MDANIFASDYASDEITEIGFAVAFKGFAFNHNVISHAFSPPYFFFPTVREITFASALVLPSPRAFLYL